MATNKLELAFVEFHSDNPQVYTLFKKFTAQITNAGHTRYSADAVMHQIRWHFNITTRTRDGFKLNNNHVAFYARKFMDENRKHKDLFNKRISAADAPQGERRPGNSGKNQRAMAAVRNTP